MKMSKNPIERSGGAGEQPKTDGNDLIHSFAENYKSPSSESNLTSEEGSLTDKVAKGAAGASNLKINSTNENNIDNMELDNDKVEESIESIRIAVKQYNADENEARNMSKEDKRRLQRRNRLYNESEEELKAREERECMNWFNKNGKRYTAPVPKYLILRDLGRRAYSKENIMKRTAWMGQALGVMPEQVPEMRRIVVRDQTCIAITAEDPNIAKKLLQIDQLGPCQVEIMKDPLKNSVYGVLFDFDDIFGDLSEEAIVELLHGQGVIRVTRFKKGKDKEPTRSYKLAFDGLICPMEIKVRGIWFRIREYVPPPLRCFRCQRYKHSRGGCRSKVATCQICGEEGHEARIYDDTGRIVQTCDKVRKCVNCKGDHEAGFKDCPTHVDWQKVNQLVVNQKLSRQEAEIRVFPREGRRTPSDAQVVVARLPLEELEKKKDDEVIKKLNDKMDRVLQGEGFGAIQALSAKVDKILEISPKAQQELDIDEKIRLAVSGLQKRLDDSEKEHKKKFESLQNQLNENKKTIMRLKTENQDLKVETKDLRLQLAEAITAKEKLQRELDTKRKDKSTSYTKPTAKRKNHEDQAGSSSQQDDLAPTKKANFKPTNGKGGSRTNSPKKK